MNKKIITLGFILVLTTLSYSGCLEYLPFDDGSTTYESHPTKIKYTISYGYNISCTGLGKYNILYNCDLPELINGLITNTQILYTGYTEQKVENNNIVTWDIDSVNADKNQPNTYKLGIKSDIESQSYLITDLTGADAATTDEIKNNYIETYQKFTKKQTANGHDYIDPDNKYIQTATNDALKNVNTNNSFIIAKQLFSWLKENTKYKLHTTNNDVQSAQTTCILKTGDCDDLSFLYISMCRTAGVPARFIRGYLLSDEDGVVSIVAHAWVEVFVGEKIGKNGWIPVECAGVSNSAENLAETEIHQNFGLESAYHLRLFTDDGTNESLNFSISGPLVKYDSGMKIEMKSFAEIEKYLKDQENELHIDKDGQRRYQ